MSLQFPLRITNRQCILCPQNITLPSLGSQLGLIIVIKMGRVSNPASQGDRLWTSFQKCHSRLGERFGRAMQLKRGCSLYSFNTSLQEKTTPRLGRPSGWFQRHKPPLSSHFPPSEKFLHGLSSQSPGYFSFLRPPVFSSAAVSMAGFIPSNKMLCPAPPRHPRLPLLFLFFALLRLLFTPG